MSGSLFSSKKSLAGLEFSAALALTAAAAILHFTFLEHAGGLWRDEVVSFNIAAQPSLAQMHEAVRFDSFPNLYHLVLRGWIGLGFGASDLGTRSLGLAIGLGVLGALWWNARTFGSKAPLFSLLLIGVSGLSVRTIDAVRAYGIGVLCIAFCFGLIWRLVTQPSAKDALLAAAASLLSVQALYQNAFLLGALCLAGMLTCLRRRLWQRAALIGGVGLMAAVSLVIYLPALRQLGELRPLIAAHVGLPHLLSMAVLALRDGSNGRLCLWICLLVGYLVFAWRSVRKPAPLGEIPADVVPFTLAAFALGIVLFFAWLLALGFPTQIWYYLPLMTFAALALDAAWPALFAGDQARLVRVYAVGAGAGLCFLVSWPGVHMRQTNVDVIAARLGHLAAPEDLIIVDQWYNGASFSRYFAGKTPWTTLPPLRDQKLQRLDLFKQAMLSESPTEPVQREIVDTLKSGHRVWVAGGLPHSSTGKPPPHLPPAPNSSVGWDHDAYSYIWAWQVGDLLQRHAGKAGRVDLALGAPINEFENLPLWVVQGWRDAQKAKPESLEAVSLTGG
jgi:hypothetical protein